MSKYWSNDLTSLTPYVPGEYSISPGVIKLNTNENPFRPSNLAMEAMKDAIDSNIRLYPDSENTRLKKVIAEYHKVDPENVFVGNGSDEVLAHIFRGLLKKNNPVLFPDITYSFYPSYCGLFDIQFEKIPLDNRFEINWRDYVRPNGGVVLPNPNAPTGIFTDLSRLVGLVEANSDSVVVIDEAYIDFGGDSIIPTIGEHPNLLVTRTFSKSYSLAGVRVGYAVGSLDLINGLTMVKNSFNSYPVDSISEAGAIAALRDNYYFKSICENIVQNREYLIESLDLIGFRSLPSVTNFICVRKNGVDGKMVANELKKRNILVRHFSKPDRLNPYVRITVGTIEQCETLVKNMNELFG